MMGVAAGMAMNGLRPVAYTITPFVTTRCLEQIRTDVCYHEAPVTIVAVRRRFGLCRPRPDASRLRGHLVPALDSQHGRDLPGRCHRSAWRVARRDGAGSAGLYPHGQEGRTGGSQGGPVADFEIGKAITIDEGSDVCLLSTGNMLPEVDRGRAQAEGTEAFQREVVSFHTVKPLDEACLEGSLRASSSWSRPSRNIR